MIPKDLILEIFLRLSVKDLVRFQCLSKEFCQEIHSAAFTTAHLNRSKKTKTHRKLVVYNGGYKDDNSGLYVADFDDENEISKLDNPLNPDGCLIRDGFHVYGSCNGLLLLYNNNTFPRMDDDGDEVYYRWLLLNPFTRKFNKVIPCPRVTPFHAQTLYGFGYDSIGNDYKLVQIIRPENWKYQEKHRDVEIWVFSFASNTWKRKQNVPFCHNKLFPDVEHEKIGVFANGALHWLSKGIDETTQEIVTFDLSSEVFVNSVHSDSLSRCSRCIAYLLDIGGSLALLRRDLDVFHQYHDELYLAVKCEEHYNWTKLYNISLELCHSCVLIPPILRVMEESNDEIPFSDRVAQRGFNGGWCCWVSFYWETLVWPAGTDYSSF
ncbi:hypothetical protein COLO4_14602 [Corchorus olitorius]|uniref:F-box domain-containing protein n=1 Tax=Corchorus olitorius TaxID=93759 RepID=A0A1R3JRS2_9ROSI|nr:hypothetical protein COLO4_14602 [Corchorus olitorius]